MTLIVAGVLVWLLGNAAFVLLRYRATADRRPVLHGSEVVPAQRSADVVPAPVDLPTAGRGIDAVPSQSRRRAADSGVLPAPR